MSKEDRFALLNTLSFNDKFFDNENEEYLDSLDVVRILNHYDKTLGEFIKRDVEQKDKIADLEAKLAEKNKEIEQLKKFDDLNKTFFDLFRTAFKEPNKVDDLLNTLKTMQEKQDQDKISFAVEQLEKVLPSIKATIELAENRHQMKDQVDIIIYNQINELKKEMKSE